MSPTRRDLFKIAAGLGLTGVVPTIAERIDAAKVLDVPRSDAVMLDPAKFVDYAESGARETINNYHLDAWWAVVCPEQHAKERQALEAFEREWPGIAKGGPNGFWEYQEAVYALALDLYDVGLRHGAAFEHLRRNVVGEIEGCRSCWGVGVLRSGETCSNCGGTGLVATGSQIGASDIVD